MNPKTLVVLAALALSPVAASAATEHARVALPVTASTEVSVENLVGVMTIVGEADGELVVEVERVGATVELARGVELKHRVSGDRVEIWLEYPSDDIVYDPDGGEHNSRVEYRGDRYRIRSGGRGDEVHANVTVHLPRGVALRAFNAVGQTTAAGVHGGLAVRTASGSIAASGGSGDWKLRSGSGRVMVEHFDGELDAQTGSGRIMLEDVEGDIEAQAGSGRIVGASLAGSLDLTTGSGGIELEGVTAVGEFEAQTGSGSIKIAGDLSKVTDLDLQTGSGSIRLEIVGGLNVELVARTGSGSIDVDVPGMNAVTTSRSRVEATLGTGEGRARLRTGSGSIRISGR